MAGQPASLSDVQAAVLKSAADKAGAQGGNPTYGAPAVAQDLAVMADQAQGYSAGVAAGVDNAKVNSAAQNSQQAEAKAQSDALRSAQLASQQAQTAALNERARQAAEAQQAKVQAANAANIARKMSRDLPPEVNAAFQDLLGQTTDYNDAKQAIDSYQKFGGLDKFSTNGMIQTHLHQEFLNYAQMYHDALQGQAAQKRVSLGLGGQ